MSFNINYNDEVTDITIFGQLIDQNQREELIKVLDLYKNQNLHITFLDIYIIPRKIVEKLFLLQQGEKCTISTSKRYLYSYLYSLGIRCRYTFECSALNKTSGNLVTKKRELSNKEVYDFLKELNTIYGYDYTEYQIDSVIRRINIAMTRESIYDFNLFREHALNNEEVFKDLFLDLSINITEFFRDPDVFNFIRNKVLPYLNSYSHIKIWCAGCSNGKEVYSLAMMLKETGMLEKTQIYATDINPYVIEEAKNGIYSMKTLSKDISNYRYSGGKNNFIQYFDISNSYIKIKDELMKNILFFQHSLLSNGRLNEFNLIICRNVFIYFNDSLQENMLKNFNSSLGTNGFLVLGKSEGIQKNNGQKYFVKYDESHKVYKKVKN